MMADFHPPRFRGFFQRLIHLRLPPQPGLSDSLLGCLVVALLYQKDKPAVKRGQGKAGGSLWLQKGLKGFAKSQ
jgi:hypothetical protein